MKFLPVCFLMVVGLPALVGGQSLQQFSQPFQCSADCRVAWAATNRLPSKVKAFKVTPTRFSEAVISNLLETANLTQTEKKTPVQSGVFMGRMF
jgi:hypothetical protein